MSEIKLINDNCVNAMNNMDAETIDLIITDPPYNLGNFMKDRDTNLKKMRDNFFADAGWDNMDFEDWTQSMDEFFQAAARVMKKGGSVIVFMAIIKVETVIKLAEKHGFYYKTTGIWHKTNPMPRNMNLHFVNSTEAWIYFTYKTRTGTIINANVTKGGTEVAPEITFNGATAINDFTKVPQTKTGFLTYSTEKETTGENQGLNKAQSLTLYGTENTETGASSATYYVLVWLEETGAEQQDVDASTAELTREYKGTITFDAVDAQGNKSGVTATFLS